MGKLGIANSRMKDFYDLEVLSRAFLLTEKPRGRYSQHIRPAHDRAAAAGRPLAFAPDFYDDADRVRQWTAFSHKSRTYVEPIEFTRIQHGEFLNCAKIRWSSGF